MGDKSTIEWTDATWNPVRGCSIVSKGCTNCYAMRQAHRHNGKSGAYEGLTKPSKGGPVWTGDVRMVPALLDTPGRWKRPRRIFVNSMSDLFHEGVPDEFIGEVWRRMAWNQQHVFQILTKRPERMLEWVNRRGQDAVFAGDEEEYKESMRRHGWPLRNVWLGVSVEDQPTADARIPLLLRTAAAVRWISAEPLLGPLDLERYFEQWPDRNGVRVVQNGDGIDWIVAGGESGPGARRAHPDWIRALRDQCAAAAVPFFFKQWGSHLPGEIKRGDPMLRWQDGRNEWYGDHQDIKYQSHWLTNEGGKLVIAWPTSKKSAGRSLDGRTHDEYPA